MSLRKFFLLFLWGYVSIAVSQNSAGLSPVFVETAVEMNEISPLIGRSLIPRNIAPKGNFNPRRVDLNKSAPGKGFPQGKDALLIRQENFSDYRVGDGIISSFEVNSRVESPSDPTGAIGPNHYVSANNSSFAIHNRAGEMLVPPTSLQNIFPGENDGDPVVLYDRYADRFIITQFDDEPDGLLIAVSKGSDPINDGWYTYRFNTNGFPDYPKYSIWSNGFYITANKNRGIDEKAPVIYVLEREQLLLGNPNARILGFSLPGVKTDKFYSPAAFHSTGDRLPSKENKAKVIFMQDDSWSGVDRDFLKLWDIDVNWNNIGASLISEAEEIETTPFDSLFDGGSINNLPQPQGVNGERYKSMDALQSTVMYATNYRRFCDYNAVVLNFSVDIDDRENSDKVSGIRWFELRQYGDQFPWKLYQEGTYRSPDGKSAWCASMALDMYGNIGMAYTTVGTVDNGAKEDSFVSIHYTGRLADDEKGIMTFEEQLIKKGTAPNKHAAGRYGDYAHLTVDPIDDLTFWHIAECFEKEEPNVRDIVASFRMSEPKTFDVGVVAIDVLNKGTLSEQEKIQVTIKNFGNETVSNIPLRYFVNANDPITEVAAVSLEKGEELQYTFEQTADLSNTEVVFLLTAESDLQEDSMPLNNCTSAEVRSLAMNDVGVVALLNPKNNEGGAIEHQVTVLVQNFGSQSQSNFPVYYILDNGNRVEQTFQETIESLEVAEFTFDIPIFTENLEQYSLESGTVLKDDDEYTNDVFYVKISTMRCMPTSDCKSLGDGIISFELANVTNKQISCNQGYEDFTNLMIDMDLYSAPYPLTVQTGYAKDEEQQLSLWIDYNDNTIFEPDELLLQNEVIRQKEVDQKYLLDLGENVVLGEHILRIRAGDTKTNNGASLNDPCDSMQFGTTHDYIVRIGKSNHLNQELEILSLPNNQFRIMMSDSFTDPILRLSVYSIEGKVLATNLVTRNEDSRFKYDLDMSYAATGVYFVRIGSSATGKTGKFIVR